MKDTRCVFTHKGIQIMLISYVGVLVDFCKRELHLVPNILCWQEAFQRPQELCRFLKWSATMASGEFNFL